MTPKATDQGSPRSTPATTAASASQRGRKPWVKKTPVQAVLDQITRLREEVTKKEEELKTAKRQLAKLEEVTKALESL